MKEVSVQDVQGKKEEEKKARTHGLLADLKPWPAAAPADGVPAEDDLGVQKVRRANSS